MAPSSDSVDVSPDVSPRSSLAPAATNLPRRPISFSIAGGNPAQLPDKPPGKSQVDAFPLQGLRSQLPSFPRPKRPSFSRHRHDANPALALKVLQDIQVAVDTWHHDLKQTVQRIQALYLEGPIVDGWLETVDGTMPPPNLDAALLRHGDPQALSGYVDRLCESLGSPGGPTPAAATPTPTYRLCSLDSDGQVTYFPCPPEQLSTISLAIARHQKLRQLLDHKQYLEAKLKRAVDELTSSRDTLGIAPACSSVPDAPLD